MNKFLKQMLQWNRRKAMLITVLLFSILLLCFSFYHFVVRSNRLEYAAVKDPALFKQANDADNGWAYSGSGAAIFLIVLVFFLLLREIRLRKKLMELFKVQKEHYRITISSMTEGLITTDQQGEIVYMNPAAERLTGWGMRDAKKQPLEKIYEVVNETTRQPFDHVVSRILKKPQVIEFENNTLLKTKDNRELIICNSGAPLFDKKGDLTGTVLVFYDITEKKKIETELKESEKQYRTLIQDLPEAVYTCDTEGYIKLYNKAAVVLWGKEPQAGKDRWCGSWNLFKTDGTVLPVNSSPMAMAIKESRPVYGEEIIVQRPDGSVRHVLPYPSPLYDASGNFTGAINMMIDVTEKKEKEILVTQTEQFSAGILNSVSAHIAVVNASGTIIKTNAAWNNFALENDIVLLDKCSEGANYFNQCRIAAIAGDTIAAETLEGVAKVLDGTIKEFYVEYPCHTLQQERWFYMKVNKFESIETLLVIEHHDITERKKAELKTLKAMERYNILSKATSDTIWDWDIVNGRMQYNSAIKKVFGYKATAVENVFDWWKESIHPDDLDYVTYACGGALKKGAQNIQLEYRFRCADGSYKYIYDRAFVIYDQDLQPVRMIGAMQDITSAKEEEKRIAKAIINAQEQERRYIGAELHDNVNQLLAGSLLSIGMIKHFQGDTAKVLELTELTKSHTMNALNEIRKLSHQLVPVAFGDIKLKDNFETLLAAINLGNRFRIKFYFDDRISKVFEDDIQVNLYRILQEQTKNILKYSKADLIEIEVTQSGNAVRMRVFDNGIGFNEKEIKNGIGFSNMKRRVESFAGKFMLKTQPGNGCEIVVEIPSANAVA